MKAPNPSLVLAAFAAFALVGCGSGGGGGSLSTGDLAVVNGDSISMAEYYRYLERKPAVQVAAQEPMQLQAGQAAEMAVASPLGFQAMRDLINRRVLLQLAKDDKVMPTDADVQKELDFQTKQNPQFMQRLTAQGLTLEDIRRDLTLDLAKENILTKGITVTAADADDFIKKNPQKFMSQEEAKIAIVQVKDDAGKKQVDTELASGKPFEEVASQYSTDPKARVSRGVFPVTNVAQMQPALQDIIRATGEGKTTDWKQDGPQWVKIFVEQKVAAKPRTIDANMKESVRRAIALDRGTQAADLPKRLVEKLKTSTVVVTPLNLKSLWDTAFKTLQEQDVTANTRTGAAGTTAPTAPPTPTAPTTGK